MKKLQILFLTLVFCLFLAVPAIAKTVTITFDFDAAAEASITGFRLYETDTPGQYLSPAVMEIESGERAFVFTIPDTDQCYSWTVVPYSSLYGTEGNRSNEASVCITGGAVVFPTPTATPQILNVTITD